MTARTAASRGPGPLTQPTFHPVKENVLPPEEMVSGSFRHAGQGGQRDVGALEDQVLVDLVGHGQEVTVAAQLGDLRQLVGAEDLAGRIVRGVEEEHPGPRADRPRPARPGRRTNRAAAGGPAGRGPAMAAQAA